MTILCPIDFSEPSRGALRYAAVAASYAGESLTLLTVNDPLLEQAAAMANGPGSLDADALRELRKFFNDTFSGRPPSVPVDFSVATGKPDAEILRAAVERKARLIVMSSRGATGIRKLFLGSVTERVLRATTVPVLVTPPADAGPAAVDDIRKTVRRILVPVDITFPGMAQTVEGARQIGVILGAPILLVHVIEPVRAMVPGHAFAANVDSERRDHAEQILQDLVDTLPDDPRIEPLVMFGEPAEEVAKIAADRQAGLIVMGLHASAMPGARMGSVTYRVLSIAHELVLALPPQNP
ncbi:MAG TPA: universal stress protein [Vicinamibacterales bacterium]|nr:universal stress protein [Vicinamibacterales bacterium]